MSETIEHRDQRAMIEWADAVLITGITMAVRNGAGRRPFDACITHG